MINKYKEFINENKKVDRCVEIVRTITEPELRKYIEGCINQIEYCREIEAEWVWIQLLRYINELIGTRYQFEFLPPIDGIVQLAWEHIEDSRRPNTNLTHFGLAKIGDTINFIARSCSVPQHTKEGVVKEIISDIMEDAPFMSKFDYINSIYGDSERWLEVIYKVRFKIEQTISDDDVKLYIKSQSDFINTYGVNVDVVNVYPSSEGRLLDIFLVEEYVVKDLLSSN